METTTAPFFTAIRQGDRGTVEKMLAQDPHLAAAHDTSGLSAVTTAMYNQQPTIADLLIQAGAPLDLFEAAAAGRLERASVLLEADPSQANAWAPDGFQPLGLACFFSHTAVAELLLAHGAEVNSPSRNNLKVQPLNSAVAAQNLAITRLLLEHGADPNARQGEDFTPLHAAAQNGQVDMIQLLLEHGADPNAKSATGKTPYDLAVEANQNQAAKLLQ